MLPEEIVCTQARPWTDRASSQSSAPDPPTTTTTTTTTTTSTTTTTAATAPNAKERKKLVYSRMPVHRGASGRGKNGDLLPRAANLPRCQVDIAPVLPGLRAPLAAAPAVVESTAYGLLADLVDCLVALPTFSRRKGTNLQRIFSGRCNWGCKLCWRTLSLALALTLALLLLLSKTQLLLHGSKLGRRHTGRTGGSEKVGSLVPSAGIVMRSLHKCSTPWHWPTRCACQFDCTRAEVFFDHTHVRQE